jgi:hypothetical protein
LALVVAVLLVASQILYTVEDEHAIKFRLSRSSIQAIGALRGAAARTSNL